jgi:hypothetical protein
MSANSDNPSNRGQAPATDDRTLPYVDQLVLRLQDRPHGDKLFIDYLLSLMEKDEFSNDLRMSLRADWIKAQGLIDNSKGSVNQGEADPQEPQSTRGSIGDLITKFRKLSPELQEVATEVLSNLVEKQAQPDLDPLAGLDLPTDIRRMLEILAADLKRRIAENERLLKRVTAAEADFKPTPKDDGLFLDGMRSAQYLVGPDEDQYHKNAWCLFGVMVANGVLPAPDLSYRGGPANAFSGIDMIISVLGTGLRFLDASSL